MSMHNFWHYVWPTFWFTLAGVCFSRFVFRSRWFKSLNPYEACALGATILAIGTLTLNWIINAS